MKLSAGIFSLLPTVLLAAPQTTVSPTRVSFKALQEQDESTMALLMKVFSGLGMLSVTAIPGMNQGVKQAALQGLPMCVDTLLKHGEDAGRQIFEDGTERRTIAASAGEPLNVPSSFGECKAFNEASDTLRGAVQEVTATMGQVMTKLLGTPTPLLTSEDGKESFTFEDIVAKGDNLEHFHSYVSSEQDEKDLTIDWHTDQGLMLMFTPALVDGVVSKNDFYIQMEDGTAAMVEFEEEDQLVVLLGDGVNQYVNYQGDHDLQLRAVPHAMSMKAANSQSPRTWFGLMVLPPGNAIHPMHGETFATLRRALNSKETTDPYALSLGCAYTLEGNRRLQDQSADDCDTSTQLYCWHRCQDIAVSCGNQQLVCANEAGTVWDGGHRDATFQPRCQETGDTGSSSGAGCFSPRSTVQVQGKGTISITELQIGDHVLAGADGEYSRVYSFGHLDANKEETFVQIFSEGSTAPLELTSNHMLFVAQNKAVRAEAVQVGDVLNGINKVTKIDSVERKGVYAPITESGEIVVGGIRASSYVAFLDYIPYQHYFVHAFFGPQRVLCNWNFGWCESETYTTDGFSNWSNWAIQLYMKANSFGAATQYLLAVITVPALGVFYCIEQFFVTPLVPLTIIGYWTLFHVTT